MSLHSIYWHIDSNRLFFCIVYECKYDKKIIDSYNNIIIYNHTTIMSELLMYNTITFIQFHQVQGDSL